MRFAGIDIGSQFHVVALVDEAGSVLVKPTHFDEDVAGYTKLMGLLGPPEDLLVVMEATGHYSRNLFVFLARRSFRVAVVNPLRTRRFAEADLVRAKTDTIDALGVARFAAQKRPSPTPNPDPPLDELRELVRFQARLRQDFGDLTRQLHRLVDLCFPEFTRLVCGVHTHRATALLRHYPTAQAFAEAKVDEIARVRCDPRRSLGRALAGRLLEAAKVSVGQHTSPVYAAHVRFLCDTLDSLRQKLHEVTSQIEDDLGHIEIGRLLLSIEGLGALSVARLLAAVGDPARFRNARSLAAYAGVVPGTKQSGLSCPGRASISPLGNAALRKTLYMTVLGAVRRNPWLKAFYQRLRRRGKLPKVALVAAIRKLLVAVYYVAKHRRPFVPAPTPDDQAPRV